MTTFIRICVMKQFGRGKLNSEVLKNFACATHSCLVLAFKVYHVRDTFLDNSAKDLGIGTSTNARLIQSLSEFYEIFMDRYFLTLPLLEFSLANKLYGTATIMKSWIPGAVHLASFEEL